MGERFPVSYLLPYHLAPLPPLLFLIIDAIIEPRLISIVSQHLPHQATQEQETEKQRTRAEWETNETTKQRHELRYRTINHLITLSPDPLLRALPRLRPLNNPPPPGRREEQTGAGCPCGWDDDRKRRGCAVPLSRYRSFAIPHSLRRCIHAPFLLARLPMRDKRHGHENDRTDNGRREQDEERDNGRDEERNEGTARTAERKTATKNETARRDGGTKRQETKRETKRRARRGTRRREQT